MNFPWLFSICLDPLYFVNNQPINWVAEDQLLKYVYLSMKEGSLFCFVVMRSTKLGCFIIVFLVSFESSRRRGLHVLGSMAFGLAVQKFLNIEWFFHWKIKLNHSGAWAWIHGVWTCCAKVLKYWMIFSLKVKLNHSWKFWRN
jgi:hypothetical protein